MKMKKIDIIIAVAIFIGGIVYALFGGSGFVTNDCGDTAVTVSVPNGYSYTVNYEDIQSIELIDMPELGECIDGGSEKKISYGVWKNELWGNYTACVSERFASCILITCKDGSHYIFTSEIESSTEPFYQSFVEFVQEAVGGQA